MSRARRILGRAGSGIANERSRAPPSVGDVHLHMRDLPPTARAFVALTIVVGTGLLVALTPWVAFRQPALFVALLLLSSLTSAFKVTLPLARSGSRCRCRTRWTSRRCCCSARTRRCSSPAASAWSQCTFRMTRARTRSTGRSSAWRRSSITVQAAGLVYYWCGRRPTRAHRLRTSRGRWSAPRRPTSSSTRSGRDRDRAVDATVDLPRLERELPVERAQLLRRAPARRRSPRWSCRGRATGCARSPSRRST